MKAQTPYLHRTPQGEGKSMKACHLNAFLEQGREGREKKRFSVPVSLNAYFPQHQLSGDFQCLFKKKS